MVAQAIALLMRQSWHDVFVSDSTYGAIQSVQVDELVHDWQCGRHGVQVVDTR